MRAAAIAIDKENTIHIVGQYRNHPQGWLETDSVGKENYDLKPLMSGKSLTQHSITTL